MLGAAGSETRRTVCRCPCPGHICRSEPHGELGPFQVTSKLKNLEGDDSLPTLSLRVVVSESPRAAAFLNDCFTPQRRINVALRPPWACKLSVNLLRRVPIRVGRPQWARTVTMTVGLSHSFTDGSPSRRDSDVRRPITQPGTQTRISHLHALWVQITATRDIADPEVGPARLC